MTKVQIGALGLSVFAVAALWVDRPAVAAESGKIMTVSAAGGVYPDQQGFKGFDYVEGSARLPYRLFVPGGSKPSAGFPLLLYVHGLGSIGSDNVAPLKLSARFGTPEFQGKHPCFVLVPQCPGDKRWIKVKDWAAPFKFSEEPAVPMKMLITLLTRIVGEYPIDPARIYVGGPSMGGFATWDIVSRLPDRFAAAFPLCGGADAVNAPKLVKLPIWCFHGAKDGTVPVGHSREMIAALKAAGGTPKYTEYPNAGHNVWDSALGDAQLFDWLFAQTRTGDTAKK